MSLVGDGHGHRIDDDPPVPARAIKEILREAALAGPQLAALLGRLMLDRRVSIRRKLVVLGVAGYLLSPVDLIPDIIPVFGQVDDLVLIAVAIKVLVGGVPEEVLRSYWHGSEDALDLVTALAEWGAEMVPNRLRRLLVP
jgi:uncharacterized membrane protein YkvA (DUF1232 family)